MLQELRDYWLPMMLLVGALLIAAVLLIAVGAAPFVIEHLPSHPLLDLFAADTTVRRVSIAGAIGLIVSAFVFFRPNGSAFTRKPSSKKPLQDTMAGE